MNILWRGWDWVRFYNPVMKRYYGWRYPVPAAREANDKDIQFYSWLIQAYESDLIEAGNCWDIYLENEGRFT